MLYLSNPPGVSSTVRRSTIDAMNELNRLQLGALGDPAIAAHIENYELAFRMQTEMPTVQDLSGETKQTLALYGLDDPVTENFGRQCLMARRFAEAGVRVIQVTHSDGKVQWDQHGNLKAGHENNALAVDQPIAGLLKDLKSRGLWDSTLVVWTSEFGRTSWGESGTGRDHNPWGYTQWLAGGGLKAGFTYGETDEVGLQVADKDKAVDTYDLHATVLHLMGLDHLKTTFIHNGRSERPTVVYGKVIKEILA